MIANIFGLLITYSSLGRNNDLLSHGDLFHMQPHLALTAQTSKFYLRRTT